MIFKRDRYTEALIRKKWNSRIKVMLGTLDFLLDEKSLDR